MFSRLNDFILAQNRVFSCAHCDLLFHVGSYQYLSLPISGFLYSALVQFTKPQGLTQILSASKMAYRGTWAGVH